jgi:HK97 family phage major capsid protein
VSGLQGNVSFPKQTGKVSGSWVGENPGSDVADSNLTLGQVPTSPKTYQSSTSYSRQLLAQAVIDVDTLVREDLARDMALAVDLAAITGTGVSNDPTGVLHANGVTSYVNATEATTNNPGYDDVIHMLEQLEDTNADQLGDPGWLTTPGMKAYFKLLPRLANAIALPAWTDDDELAGYMARSTNQVPKTGTTTHHTGNDQHALIVGVWQTTIFATWGNGFELIVDPYRLKKQGMIELTTFMLSDFVMKYPQAFVVSFNQK